MREGMPKLLWRYKNSDYITQEGARFIYYLCVTVLLTILLLFALRLFTEPFTNYITYVHLFAFLTAIAGCFLFLIRGYYLFISHLIPVVVMIATWGLMFFEKGSMLVRMDTVVNLFIAFSMFPLLAGRSKSAILIYTGINIALVFVFAFYLKYEFSISQAEFFDYLIDVAVSLAFIGFVGLNIYSVNKKALEHTQRDFNHRLKIEKEITLSKKRYEELSELLPTAIFECNLEGNIVYANKAAFNTFGYDEEDMKKGVNVSSLVVEKDLIVSNLNGILNGNQTGHYYTALKKQGETFPVQIFSSTIDDEGTQTGIRGVIIDISDRVNAEAALKASERKFREMTMLLPQTVFESDTRGNLTFMNKAGTDMFGFSEDDIRKGINVLNTLVYEDHERAKENVRQILSGLSTKGNQYTGQNKDGSTFPVQIQSAPIIEDEKIVGFRGVVMDLTKIKEVENELRQSNELFKTLFESIPIPISLSGTDHKLVMVNRAFCNDMELSQEEIIGKAIWELGVKTDVDKEAEISRILKEKGYVENFEIEAINRNGKKHFLYVYATTVTINNQRITLRTNVNVTDKIALESKLKESETLFRTIVNMVPYSITILDVDNRYAFCNRAFLERFHLSINDVKGKTMDELGIRFEEESIQRYFKEYHEKGSVYNLEVNINVPGQKICSLLSSQPVTIDHIPHTIATTVEITDRKSLEEQLVNYNLTLEHTVKERTEELVTTNEELSATNEELFAKNEIIIEQNEELNSAIELLKNTQMKLIQTEKMASLGILTAGVAHEVNNPLNFLMGAYLAFENYFQEHGIKDDQTINMLLESMRTGIERITKIVKGLNEFSRNNEDLNENCDIHNIIDDCLSMLHNKLKHKIQVTRNFNIKPIIINGNVGQMHQVFVNLISNAIQAIPEKGNIDIKTTIIKSMAVVEIADNGIGIQKEDLSRITDPFFTTKPPGEGTGLGLSITQAIINAHQGKMKFESEINKGTKVIMSFPLT